MDTNDPTYLDMGGMLSSSKDGYKSRMHMFEALYRCVGKDVDEKPEQWAILHLV